MIHISNEKIDIEGTQVELLADLTTAVYLVKGAVEKVEGKEVAEKDIAKVFELANKTEEEIEKEAVDQAEKQAERFLQKIFGGGTTDSPSDVEEEM